jgi:protein tyrosine phosphatase (PTP) superfamily phosphohydrolase (DUF442 family)
MNPQELNRINNFLLISPSVATSGQPTKEQFAIVKAAGYLTIINLALPSSNNALLNEQEIVETLGMDYIHIPVLWEDPTKENLATFFTAIEIIGEQKVLVHCAMNMRVSAFIYLYRILKQNIDPTIAILDLNKIWQPNKIWQSFIDRSLAISLNDH